MFNTPYQKGKYDRAKKGKATEVNSNMFLLNHYRIDTFLIDNSSKDWLQKNWNNGFIHSFKLIGLLFFVLGLLEAYKRVGNTREAPF